MSEEMQSTTLCPFCKNTDTDLLILHKLRHKIQMECIACDAKGPARLTEEEAFEYWIKICELS